jgi:uncharacterized protein YodC (DUF2158 family)
MADEEFKEGDTVQLKSGGPVMTIEHIGEYGMVPGSGHTQAKCVWFDKTKKMQGVFELFTLTHA